MIYIYMLQLNIFRHFANILLTSFLFWCGFMCLTIGGGFWTYRLQSTEHVCGCPSLALTEDQCKPKPSTLWRDSSTPDESLQDFQVVSPRLYFKSSPIYVHNLRNSYNDDLRRLPNLAGCVHSRGLGAIYTW